MQATPRMLLEEIQKSDPISYFQIQLFYFFIQKIHILLVGTCVGMSLLIL